MRTIKTPVSELGAQFDPNYIDIGLLDIIAKEIWGDPVILKGPKGTGKTAGIEQYCAINQIPFIRFDCNEWTNLRDLQGSMTAHEDQGYAFALGCATSAIETANEVGECVLALEEFNALTPNAQKVLNGVADHRQSVMIPKIGKVFKLEHQRVAETTSTVVSIDVAECTYVVFEDETVQEVPNNLGITVKVGDSVKAGDPITVNPKIWLVGTMNPNYSGTYQINEDMRSRFDFIDVPYMPRAEEQKVLYTVFGGKPSREEKSFIKHLQTIALETRAKPEEGGKSGYALSPRDLLKVCRRFKRSGDRKYALKVLSGKFDGEHRKNYEALVKRVFGEELSGSLLYGNISSHNELQNNS